MGYSVYLYKYIVYISYLNSVSQSAATVWNLEIRGFSVAHSRACLVLEKNMLDHGPRTATFAQHWEHGGTLVIDFR